MQLGLEQEVKPRTGKAVCEILRLRFLFLLCVFNLRPLFIHPTSLNFAFLLSTLTP